MGIRYTFISEDLPIDWPVEVSMCFLDAGIGVSNDILYSLLEKKWWGSEYDLISAGLELHVEGEAYEVGENIFYCVELSETGQVARIEFSLQEGGAVSWERRILQVPSVRY